MPTLPSLFVSHGAPTFALEPGLAGAQLAALGEALPRPRAVVVVSPHWMTRGLHVGFAGRPATIHDFGGFPAALYALTYPAAGHAGVAQRALELLAAAGLAPRPDPAQGLDHGVWVPLMHLYPRADVPVVPVSMPHDLDAEGAWALGRALAPLASEGVLVVGSGSLTHNLRDYCEGDGSDAPYARAFAGWVRDAIASGDWPRLRGTLARAPHARRAHPTPEHFWPLLVAAAAGGATGPDLATARAIDGGTDRGVLAMDAFVFGGDQWKMRPPSTTSDVPVTKLDSAELR